MAVSGQRLLPARTRDQAATRLLRVRVPILVVTAWLIVSCSAFSETKHNEYVLRIAHETENSMACALLQETGAFHYEVGDRDNTRVYEGEITAAQLYAVKEKLRAVSEISQQQIEEPLTQGSWDVLDVHLFRSGNPHELLFRSRESQEAFKVHLEPLLRWMDGLHKVPHRELSEDAGKNNCLPKRALALRTRGEITLQPPLPRTPLAGRRIAPPSPGIAAPPPIPSSPPLVWLKLQEKKSSGTQVGCALVSGDGRYRIESRLQKAGRKNVENRIARGQFTADELGSLRKILDAPALTNIRHHEPPDDVPLNIMGSVLDLSINRESGKQDLIFTDARLRTTFFYSGDADISRANELLHFVWQHLDPGASALKSPADLNGCNELP